MQLISKNYMLFFKISYYLKFYLLIMILKILNLLYVFSLSTFYLFNN